MADQLETPQDDNSTVKPPTPDTSQGNPEGDSSGGNDTIQMTPAQLKQRLDRAQQSVLSGLLEGLGVESVDGLKSVITDAKKRKEAEMSEAEKYQAQLADAQKQLEEANQRAIQLEQARLEDKRDSGLLQHLSKAHDPNKVLTLLKAEKPEALTVLMVDGTFDSKQAEKLVSEYASANAYLFQSGLPGSPSNSGGRVPPPGQKEQEKARENHRKRLRRY